MFSSRMQICNNNLGHINCELNLTKMIEPSIKSINSSASYQAYRFEIRGPLNMFYRERRTHAICQVHLSLYLQYTKSQTPDK